jgi:hypothetical protein
MEGSLHTLSNSLFTNHPNFRRYDIPQELSSYLTGGSEESYEEPRSKQSVFRWRFEKKNLPNTTDTLPLKPACPVAAVSFEWNQFVLGKW